MPVNAPRFPVLAADPVSPQTGQSYLNSTTKKLRYWNGTAWIDLPSSVVGGGSGPNYADTFHMRESGLFAPKLPDALHVRDAPTSAPKMPDTLHSRDIYSFGAVSANPITAHVRESGAYGLASLIVGRSGTPDTDQVSDAWADQAVSALNHGNESIQCKGVSTAPGSDAKLAYIQLDLTRLSGCTASGIGSMIIQAANDSLVLAFTPSLGFAVQSTRWFTESTMTYATGRPAPTLTGLSAPTIATGGGYASYTVTWSQANLATMLGKWVLFVFSGASAATPQTMTVKSRDDATASNRPKFNLSVTIP